MHTEDGSRMVCADMQDSVKTALLPPSSHFMLKIWEPPGPTAVAWWTLPKMSASPPRTFAIA